MFRRRTCWTSSWWTLYSTTISSDQVVVLRWLRHMHTYILYIKLGARTLIQQIGRRQRAVLENFPCRRSQWTFQTESNCAQQLYWVPLPTPSPTQPASATASFFPVITSLEHHYNILPRLLSPSNQQAVSPSISWAAATGNRQLFIIPRDRANTLYCRQLCYFIYINNIIIIMHIIRTQRRVRAAPTNPFKL